MAKQKLATIKKSISLREDIYDIAEDMADKYFQGNLSGFIAFTISAYKHGLTTVIQSEHPQAKESISELELTKKSATKASFIDDVMNFMDNH